MPQLELIALLIYTLWGDKKENTSFFAWEGSPLLDISQGAGPATRVVHRAAVFPSQAEKTGYLERFFTAHFLYLWILNTEMK